MEEVSLIVKIDGVENKELERRDLFLKFLKENTHGGKLDPQV